GACRRRGTAPGGKWELAVHVGGSRHRRPQPLRMESRRRALSRRVRRPAVRAVSAARRNVAPFLAPEVVLVRPSVGGVAYVGRSVAGALRSRGHTVAELELPDAGAPALRALSEAWRLRRSLRRARTVHVELGSTSLGVFWFALLVSLLRRDVVLILHDAPCLVSKPGAGLIATGTRWRDIVAYRFLAPLLDGPLTRMVRRRTGPHVVLSEPARLASLAAGSSHVHR